MNQIYSLTYLTFWTVDRVDSLEDRQKTFFANCSKNKLKGSEKDEYESIRKEYQKVNAFCHFSLKWSIHNKWFTFEGYNW